MNKFWNWVRDEDGRTLYLNGTIAEESWFEDEVIPKVKEMGEEVARGYMKWPDKPRKQEEAPTVQQPRDFPEVKASTRSSALDRLDAIILECALLKRELLQTR